MAPNPLLLLIITLKHENIQADSFHVRPVNRPDHLDLHHLASQLDKYLFPITAAQQKIRRK